MEKFYAKAQQDFMKNSRGDSQGWDDEDVCQKKYFTIFNLQKK